MRTGQQFSFIIASDIAGRMERVIVINDGRVVSKKQQLTDMVYTVEKT
jgi:hypothetical protein